MNRRFGNRLIIQTFQVPVPRIIHCRISSVFFCDSTLQCQANHPNIVFVVPAQQATDRDLQIHSLHVVSSLNADVDSYSRSSFPVTWCHESFSVGSPTTYISTFLLFPVQTSTSRHWKWLYFQSNLYLRPTCSYPWSLKAVIWPDPEPIQSSSQLGR
jgi:hypothetical protein